MTRNLVVLLSIVLVYAIAAHAAPKDNYNVDAPATPKVVIRGTVVQASDASPIERANVVLLRLKDSSIVQGIPTNAAGGFVLTHEGGEATLLRITYVGLTPLYVKMEAPTSDTLDLGTIGMLVADADVVEVTATRDGIQYLAGKKVFDVERSLTAKSGNALDVLKEVPSVNVDADGSVTLRGSAGVNIMIDNKPISVYGNPQQVLQSLPAQVLAKVEIITNPGAKYDAQGQAGIINIVLKKQQEPGVNALATLTTGLFDNYSGSLSGNRRFESVNLTAAIDGSSTRHRRFKRAESSFDDGRYLLREGDSYYKNKGYGGRIGADVTLDTSNSFNVSAEFRTSDGLNSDPYFNTFRNAFDTAYVDMQQTSSGPFITPGFNAGFRHTFSSRRHALTADVSLYPGTFDLRNSYTYTDVSANNKPLGLPPTGTRTRLNGTSLYVQANTDIVLPIDVEGSIETGLRATLMGIDAQFDFDRLDNTTSTYVRDATLSNRGLHQDNVYAAYVNYSNKYGALGIQAGLRGEYTTNMYRNPLGTGGTVSPNVERGFGGVFPSAALSFAVSEASTMQASFSRRINRPSSPMVNPFLDKSDSLNWRTGNPQLLPEYTNATELGFLQYIDKTVLNAEVFYRQTSNMINLRFRENVAPNTLLEKPYNFGSSNTYGLSLFVNAEVTEWLRVNAEYSYFHQQAEGTFANQSFNSEGYGWNGRATIAATMPFEISGQLYADYTAPTVIPQGQRTDFTILSLGLSKSFFDKRLDVAFNWTDFLNTARFGGHVSGTGFTTDLLNQRDYPLVSLTFSYKINDYQQRRGQGQPGGSAPAGGSNSI